MDSNGTNTKPVERFSICNEIIPTFYLNSRNGIYLFSNIAFIVINLVLSIFGTVANTLVIAAYATNVHLRTSSNMLLFVLAVSDLLVTAIVQPVFLVVTLNEILGSLSCILLIAFNLLACFSCLVSLVTIAVLSVERFITLAYPYSYQKIVTANRMKTMVTSSWLFMLLPAVSQLVLKSSIVFFVIVTIIVVSCVSTVVAVWVWIYRLILRHTTNIKSSQTPSDVIDKTFRQEQKLRHTRTSYLIVAAVLCCYFPSLIYMIYQLTGSNEVLVNYFLKPWVYTAAFANSVINPLLLLWRKRGFRDTAQKIRRKNIRVRHGNN